MRDLDQKKKKTNKSAWFHFLEKQSKDWVVREPCTVCNM